MLRTPLLLAALALALAPAADAQIGLKAGLNTSFLGGDDIGTDAEPRLGFVGGVTARLNVNPAFAIQAEALYSQKGDRLPGFADEGGDIVTALDYVEIPVTARIGVPLSPLLDAGVSLGAAAGIPINARKKDDDGEFGSIDAKTDFGAVIGVDVGSGPFYVDGRYTHGFTRAIEEDSALGIEPDAFNRSVSFTFGYRFGSSGPRY